MTRHAAIQQISTQHNMTFCVGLGHFLPIRMITFFENLGYYNSFWVEISQFFKTFFKKPCRKPQPICPTSDPSDC